MGQALGDEGGVAAELWFETCLRERPEGPLAPAALDRILELRVQRGDSDGARSVARAYVERFPSGPKAVEARQILEATGGETHR